MKVPMVIKRDSQVRTKIIPFNWRPASTFCPAREKKLENIKYEHFKTTFFNYEW